MRGGGSKPLSLPILLKGRFPLRAPDGERPFFCVGFYVGRDDGGRPRLPYIRPAKVSILHFDSGSS